MAIYFFQNLAIQNNEKLPKSIKYLPNEGHNFAKYQIVNWELAKNLLKFCLRGQIWTNLVTLAAQSDGGQTLENESSKRKKDGRSKKI